ncbi:unnamed protein product [Cunninghamella echinulata]
MMDYNLFGMDWLHLLANNNNNINTQHIKTTRNHSTRNNSSSSLFYTLQLGLQFRHPLPDQPKSIYSYNTQQFHSSSTSHTNSLSPSQFETYTSMTIPHTMISNTIERTSYCELEIDTTVFMISNRLDILERDIHINLNEKENMSTLNHNKDDHDLSTAENRNNNKNENENENEKLVKSLTSIWKDEQKRRKERGILSSLSSSLSQSFERNNLKNEWATEADLRKKIKKMINEQQKNRDKDNSSSSFTANNTFLTNIMTVFKSVEALYPNEYVDFLKRIKSNDNNNSPLVATSISNPNDKDKENDHLHLNMNGINKNDTTIQNRNYEQPEVEGKENGFAIPSSPPSITNENQGEIISTTEETPNFYPNILATPSRFRQLEKNTVAHVDQDMILSLLRSNSFFDDTDDENGNKEIEEEDHQPMDQNRLEKEKGKDVDEESNAAYCETKRKIMATESMKRQQSFDMEAMDGILDDDIIKWFEETELRSEVSQSHHVKVSYEQDDGEKDNINIPIRPRRIDFESLVNDQNQGQSTFKPDIFNNFENDNTQPFDISDSPPTLDFHLRKRKRADIPQVDGGGDEEEEEEKEEIEEKEDTENQNQNKPIQQMKNADKTKRFKSLSYVALPPIAIEKSPYSISKHNEKKEKKSIQQENNKKSHPIDKISNELSSHIHKKIMERHQHQHQRQQQQNSGMVGTIQHVNYRHSGSSEIDSLDNIVPTSLLVNNDTTATTTSTTKMKSNSNIINSSSTSTENEKTFILKNATPSTYSFTYSIPPPTINNHEKKVIYQEPFYEKDSDVPTIPKLFGNKEFKVVSKSIRHLKSFDTTPYGGQQFISKDVYNSTMSIPSIRSWTPSTIPPSYNEVKEWKMENDLGKKQSSDKNKIHDTHTQIKELFSKNKYEFGHEKLKPRSHFTNNYEHTDILSLEIHVNTRGDLYPDPKYDMVQLIFWCLKTKDKNLPSNGYDDSYHVGIIAIDDIDIKRLGINNMDVIYVKDELNLILSLIEMVRNYDADMLVGYELHNFSWGYLIERAQVYEINLTDQLSRVYCESQRILLDPWGYRKASVFKIIGRHMLNVWRLLRSEVDLTNYQFENLAYTVLHHRVPQYSHRTLTNWYNNGAPILKNRLLRYYIDRVQMNIDLLDISEVISRTTESARVFGIDFYSVITRGSQFKVESIMFRIAKPENFVLISPSRKQVGEQRAIECLPLIMEPISQYYNSPLLVLDFQSLYPSIMIAYNYCFSTCIGKIGNSKEAKKFGVTELNIPGELLETLEDHLNVSPNGIAFVKPSVRKSLLAKMLEEILQTRVMVKKSMKEYKNDPELLRTLDAKQLTLKLIANVTFGYTAASFSGRMPAVEIADSIVQTGRETLERTIKIINEHTKWGAKVVYSDTDSVFVYLPGKSRAEAFDIGDEISDTITKMNPAPIKLKFEKIYHPCLLISKKRYTGYKYEHRHEKEPVLEAKGIETVRRDGIPALQKIMKSCIHLLFKTQNISNIKEYLYGEWTKILSNRVSIQDFIIAKEVRLGTYKSLPHGALVAQDQMSKDPRSEPQYGERVPYVVVYQGPNAPLKDRVMNPSLLFKNRSLRLDTEYYIRKQIIPPLERIFQLIGVDVKLWYDEMPRSHKAMIVSLDQPYIGEKYVNRIDKYYSSSYCIVCKRLEKKLICDNCTKNASQTLYTLLSRQRQAQKRLETVLLLCQNCSGLSIIDVSTPELKIGNTGYSDMPCVSMSCPILYERSKACHDISITNTYTPLIDQLSDDL